MGTDKYKQVGSMSDVGILNQNEQGYRNDALSGLSGLQDNYTNILKSLSGAQMQGLLGNIGSAAGNYGNIGQGITNAANAFNNINTSGYTNAANAYNPEAANAALLSQMPGYNQAAQTAANSALSGTNQSARDLAQLATRDAMRASQAELANSGILSSGAGMQSMMEAALTPQQQLQTNLASMQSQYQGNVLGQLMGSGTQMLGQGYETQNQNQLSAALQDIARQQNAAQAGMQGAMSQLDVANSDVQAQQGVYNSYLQNLMSQLQGTQAQGQDLSNIANLTQQQYYTPQYAKKTSWLDYASAGAGILGGIGGFASGLGALGAGAKGLTSLFGGIGQGIGGLGAGVGGASALMNSYNSQGNAAGQPQYMPSQDNQSLMFNLQNPWGGGQNNFNAGVFAQYNQPQAVPGYDPMNYYGNQWGLQNQPTNFGQSVYPSAYSQ